jgi:putative DNA methylase
MAIAAQHARRRVYLSPQPEHVEAAQKADGKDFPDTDIPEKALGFRVQPYGMTKHRDLFTPRQLQTLNLFADRLREVHDLVLSDARSMEYRGRSDDDRPLYQGGAGARAYADAVVTFLAFSLSRCADFNNALCRWSPSNEKVMNLFGRAAIPMTWDYAEANPLADSVGGWSTCSRYVADCVEIISTAVRAEGVVRQRDAAKMSPTRGHLLVSTDPPYYGNIGYADLSDFFYVWLRRTIGDLHPDVCGTLLVPKTEELVATPERFGGDKTKAKEHFEGGLKRAFSVLKEKIDPRFPMTVYYAFKQADEEAHEEETEAENGAPESQVDLTTGWETMLEALITGGFQITGTWPVRASQAWRMRAMGSNALASYVVLACRARPEDAAPAARREFLATLRKEVPEALNRLQRSNIAPVDLAQAAIGPGMAVFSRYSRVLEADGSPMSVRTALALINQALDEYLTQQEGEMDADTRWALAWFEQFGIEEGPFGVAETLSKAKNTAVNALEQAGILRARGGKVRLLGRNELPDSWDPAADEQLTVWEATQHLIRELEKNGESAAAALLRQLGGLGEEVRALAYRLYTICDRKGWAQEALAYNMLVVAWPRLLELASARKPEQMGFLG